MPVKGLMNVLGLPKGTQGTADLHIEDTSLIAHSVDKTKTRAQQPLMWSPITSSRKWAGNTQVRKTVWIWWLW